METKHLIIGIVVFVMIGAAIYYMGSLLSGLETSMESQKKDTPPMVEVINKVEALKVQTQEVQRKQEELLNNQGF